MAELDSTSTSANLRWPEIDAIVAHVQIVPESILHEVNKEKLRNFMVDTSNDQQIGQVWQSLLLTFSTASTSKSHSITACNAISVFLEGALLSHNEATRALSRSHKTWTALYNICLARFEDIGPRPMKQVLGVLSKMLVRNSDMDEVERIQYDLINGSIPNILLAETKSRVKASLVVLDTFVRKRAISMSQLISRLHVWISSNYNAWKSYYERYFENFPLGMEKLKFIPDADAVDTEVKLMLLNNLNLAIVIQARNAECTTCCGSLMRLLYEESVHQSVLKYETASMAWVQPVRFAMVENVERLEAMSNHVLYSLFDTDPYGFRLFVTQLPIEILLSGRMKDNVPINELRLLFSALQTAKELALVYEDYNFDKVETTDDRNAPLILDSAVIGQFLFHEEFSVRFSTLSLLITSSSASKPISSGALQSVLRGLPALHADSDAHARGETLYLVRKLLVRLNGTQSPRHSHLSDIDSVQQFINDYVTFLKDELIPGASYPRHVMALKSLLFILNTGIDPLMNNRLGLSTNKQLSAWRFSINILSTDLCRLLVDLLVDPFEDIRAMSASLLGLFPDHIPPAHSTSAHKTSTVLSQYLLDALRKAENLASNTSRADHADSVARLYGELFTCAHSKAGQSESTQWHETRFGIIDTVLNKLETKMSHPGGVFTSAMRDAPLHGYLSALRLLVEKPSFHTLVFHSSQSPIELWRITHCRILAVCQRIWVEVKSVLCVDSPEGHTDDALEDLVVGPKDILSYSWRALRESSLLLHATVANSSYGPKRVDGGLNKKDLEDIGSLTFTQLSELRHRGAFSTVSQTFATICRRCAQSDDEDIVMLPKLWYQEAKSLIWEKASKLTRRSAGLPALITGVFWSNQGGSLLQCGMVELQELAMLPAAQTKEYSGMTLPQVHAMNCLKDIFMDTRLAPYTELFIMSSLRIAATSLGSSIWSIRNCGLMLFRALMSRMCRNRPGSSFGFSGPSGSDSGHRIAFLKYPGLTDLLTKLLSPADQNEESPDRNVSTITERVFPALELISEKISTNFDEDDSKLLALAHKQFTSPIWAVREHAARVYASLLPLHTILDSLKVFVQYFGLPASQNYLHGAALCIRFSLQRIWYSRQDYWQGTYERILSFIEEVLSTFLVTAPSPFVWGAVIDIYNDALDCTLKYQRREEGEMFMERIALAHNVEAPFPVTANNDYRLPPDINTIRSLPLLRRTLFWSKILKVALTRSPICSLIEPFSDLCVVDGDTARWVLQQLRSRVSDYKTQQEDIIRFHIAIISEQQPRHDVQIAAMLNLSMILESIIDLQDGHLDEFRTLTVGCHKLKDYIPLLLSPTKVANRNMLEANLRIQGCLLGIDALTNAVSPVDSLLFRYELQRWAINLLYAMSEETDFTTRYAAARSLTTLKYVLRRPERRAEQDSAFLGIYIMLYDMLNDDDEEIRDLAAGTASWILCDPLSAHGKNMAYSPLPAAKYLNDFIVSYYSTSKHLCHAVIERIVGQQCPPGPTSDLFKFRSVKDILTGFRQDSTVLFEVEKQNLYVDEKREVDVWTSALLHLKESAFDDVLLRSLFLWVSEGLEHLVNIAASGDKDGCLGWSSKSEIYIIGIRVISCATLFVSEASPVLPHLPQEKEIVVSQLSSLLEYGTKISLHPHWLSRIESVLCSA